MGRLFSFLLTTILSVSVHAADLRLTGTIPLAGVEGRIDHLTVDIEGKRLFVAALGNNTVEVLDLKTGARLRTITGLKHPQGIAYISPSNRLVVSCANGGTCKIYDGSTYELLHTATFGDDADNLRYDSTSGLLYVGYGNGGLGMLDPVSGAVSRGAEIHLAAHPESFQLEDGGKRIFVNVPDAKQVVIVNRATGMLMSTLTLKAATDNYPMALDEAGHRVFIGCRLPARLLVMDTDSGKLVASLPCAGDADEVFYDAVQKRIYVVGGAGQVTIIGQKDPDNYRELDRIITARGARTGLFIPELKKLYVAVPHKDSQAAQINVYEVQ